jgi:hypothetical protein
MPLRRGGWASVLAKTLAIRPTDIDDSALHKNGMGTVVVRPDDLREDGGRVTPAFSVAADFFPVGVEQRRFRTLADALAFVCSLVLTAEETARRRAMVAPAIEVHIVLRDRA